VSESRFFGGGQPVHQKRIRCLDEALAGFKSRYPFGSNVLSEEQVWRIENGHWSADEQISLALTRATSTDSGTTGGMYAQI